MRHLIAFADSRMNRSLLRLSRQVQSLDFFDSVNLLNESNLPFDFREHFKDKLVIGTRGFGYWSWKPVVILEALKQMTEGEELLYVDAGCHLNPNGKKRLNEYFQILNNTKQGILAFQANPPSRSNSSLSYDGRRLFDQPNYEWIKGDLLDYFNVRNDKEVTHSQAIGSGIILFKKCDFSMRIVKEWLEITLCRFDLVDDTPSVSPNLPGFIEHRHDQALWTLLCLKYGIKTLSAYEYWYPRRQSNDPLEPDWDSLADYPIHARRDKDMGKIQSFKYLINRSIQKMGQKFNPKRKG